MINTTLKRYGYKEVPKYCHVCGRVLRTYPILNGYDSLTGERRFGTVLLCPLPAILKMFALHTKIEFDYNGNEVMHIYY